MNSILEVEKGLPPGLWLPTAEESTEQYLTENFANKNRSDEDIIDYGAFMVALIFYEQENTGRLSMMPNAIDLQEMNRAGDGISNQVLLAKHGGLTKLQRTLGFYPREYTPVKDEVLEIFRWIAEYSYALDPLPEKIHDIEQVMAWGSARNLSPSIPKVYKSLNGNTALLRKMFNIERRDQYHQYNYHDLYSFRERVIEENEGPISTSEMNLRYADRFVGLPSTVIKFKFTTMKKFWQEFDYLPLRTRSLSQEEAVNLGVRKAIQDNMVDLRVSVLNELSRQMRFPSLTLIYDKFTGGIQDYRDKVQAGYQQYVQLKNFWHTALITSSVMPASFSSFLAVHIADTLPVPYLCNLVFHP